MGTSTKKKPVKKKASKATAPKKAAPKKPAVPRRPADPGVGSEQHGWDPHSGQPKDHSTDAPTQQDASADTPASE